MRSVPTLYNGILFRSQLESKWARFLDLIGWEWHYEPLPLNRYLPDFSLPFEHAPMILEVKPAGNLEQLHEHKAKIEASGWTGEALIVGEGIFEPAAGHPIVGLIGERETVAGVREWRWSVARAFGCLACDRISVLSEDGSWHCRQCGHGHGNSHVGDAKKFVADAWGEILNRTQWRGARNLDQLSI